MASRMSSDQRGFAVLAAIGAAAMLGTLVLCLDLGRLYIAKNELQSFSDAAAIAAANRLNGTTAGIAAAVTEAQTNVNRWSFQNSSVAPVVVDFSTGPGETFVSDPNPATGYAFVRVQAQGSVSVYFAGLFQGALGSQVVQATAVAGQTLLTALGDGAFPFSPDAHVPNPLPTDPTGNFGFVKGELYTLRWDPVGEGQKGVLTNSSGHQVWGCPGDTNTPGFIPGADNSGQRGYIDLLGGGGGGGASFIRDATLGNIQLPTPILVGQIITNANGNKQSEVSAIEERVAQDTNPSTDTYYTAPASGVGLEPPGRTYFAIDPPGMPPPNPPRGNGRRLVTVPVNDPTNDVIIGFAQFFLPQKPCGKGNEKPCCAEYVSSASLLPAAGGGSNGSGSLGLYRIKLFQ